MDCHHNHQHFVCCVVMLTFNVFIFIQCNHQIKMTLMTFPLDGGFLAKNRTLSMISQLQCVRLTTFDRNLCGFLLFFIFTAWITSKM